VTNDRDTRGGVSTVTWSSSVPNFSEIEQFAAEFCVSNMSNFGVVRHIGFCRKWILTIPWHPGSKKCTGTSNFKTMRQFAA